jgi:hypothetical protein
MHLARYVRGVVTINAESRSVPIVDVRAKAVRLSRGERRQHSELAGLRGSARTPKDQVASGGGELMMTDVYERKARLYPALLVALPIALFGVVIGITQTSWWPTASGVVVGSGFYVVAAQIGRHRGKAKELDLFSTWGGKPTTILLRHRGPTNAVRLARLHSQVEKITGLAIPSQQQESADPDMADAVYATVVDVLRDRTRDAGDFPLVFKELCNYGYRRNMWGLRPWGIAVSAFVGVLATGTICLDVWAHLIDIDEAGLILVLVASLVMTGLWALLVSPQWVRQTACAYADRLIDGVERLSSKDGTAKSSVVASNDSEPL